MMVSRRRRRAGTVLAAPMLCTAQPQPKFWVGEVGFARVVRRCRKEEEEGRERRRKGSGAEKGKAEREESGGGGEEEVARPRVAPAR